MSERLMVICETSQGSLKLFLVTVLIWKALAFLAYFVIAHINLRNVQRGHSS